MSKIRPPRTLHIRLTTGFICFYFTMIFLITALIFVVYYQERAGEEHRQNLEESSAALHRMADSLTHVLTAGNRIAFSMNIDAVFQQFLNNNFPSRQDELYAFSSHIKPTLNAMIISSPYIHNVYIYREQETFLGRDGFLGFLADMNKMPYPFNPDEENSILLVHDEDKLYVPPAQDAPNMPCIICLNNLYSPNYTEVKGVVEVQISLKDALSQVGQQEETFICSDDASYRVSWQDDMPVVSLAEPDFQQALSQEEWISCPVGKTGLHLMRSVHYAGGIQGMLWILIALACFSVITSAFFCVIIFRYTRRIRHLSQHIREHRDEMPMQYKQEDFYGDEVDDLIHAYDEQVDAICTLVNQIAQAERNQKEAHYYAMNSQIKPHFLFNTLENIRMQIEIGETNEAGHMLYSLGQLMQYNMSMRSESTLAEELQHIQHYLGIFLLRMRSSLVFEVAHQEDYQDIACPFFILQPVIENCIRHGYRGKGTVLHIQVQVEIRGDTVRILIIDDGKGIPPEEMAQMNTKLKNNEEHEKTSHHIGLFNVSARIRYLFGSGCGVELSGNAKGGLTCCLTLIKKQAPKTGVL